MIDISVSESPVFVGRAVCALADDPDVVDRRTGRAFWSAELARDHGFTDEDGSQPPVRDLAKPIFTDGRP
jgi:hypothetical protein